MVLSGSSIELIDGDTNSININIIEDLLNQVKTTIEGKEFNTVSILGVQSSGKSSLLNNMFNLNFAITGARTTKGVHMRLLQSPDGKKVYMLMDTEGLRSLEQMNVTKSKQMNNDNRLATFVIGIADICIVNLKEFDHSHLTPILQMVAKSFLKFKQNQWVPNVHSIFFHQKMENRSMVNDVGAQGNKMIAELNKVNTTYSISTKNRKWVILGL